MNPTTIDLDELLVRAEYVGRRAHFGQFRFVLGTVQSYPYVEHVELAVETVDKFQITDLDLAKMVKIVVWLHDTFEPDATSAASRLSPELLDEEGFPPEIVQYVSSMHRRSGVLYADYVTGLVEGHIVEILAKIADTLSNLHDKHSAPRPSLAQRYHRSLSRLITAVSAERHGLSSLTQSAVLSINVRDVASVHDVITGGLIGNFPPGRSVDLTGDGTQELEIEITRSAAGHKVLYIHEGGRTLVRICQFKDVITNATAK